MSMTELRTDWLIGYYALGRDILYENYFYK